MLKKTATIFGWVLIALGVLGFVPGITSNGHLLGIFDVNMAHNLVHLISGLAALYLASQGEAQAQMFFKVFGVIYLVVAVLGFFGGDMPVLGFISNNSADTWLHVVIALLSLYLGFGTKKESSMQAA
ncbi:MAG TPA: DUF4383 domain-containing protein [Candidatus Andersenbacteria bacterium]|nr:DUF4383 domain-containing protein [Candidatus Andersenbacteria bacterium]